MEEVISVQDAMAELKVNRASFYARCKKSGIKPTRQGRRSFITQEELESLGSVCLESVRQTSGSDRQQTPQAGRPVVMCGLLMHSIWKLLI